MTTRKPRKGRMWSDVLADTFDEEQIAKIREAAASELEELKSLAALRKKLGVSQVELAEIVGISQPRLSNIERTDDHRVSTLRRYIEGLGGVLEVGAVFWDEEEEREIRIPLAEVAGY